MRLGAGDQQGAVSSALGAVVIIALALAFVPGSARLADAVLTARYDYDGRAGQQPIETHEGSASIDQAAALLVASDYRYDPLSNLARTNARLDPGFFAPRAAGLADDVATTGARATGHGAERLTQAGFTDDLIAQTRAGFVTRQADGATVFAREVSPGRFDFFVEGQRGVITAHRNWSQKSIDRLARNYGWEGWPP